MSPKRIDSISNLNGQNDYKDNEIISIIMPAYNLSKQVARSIEAVEKILQKSGYKYEIILVDDGSNDDTYYYALRTSNHSTIKAYKLTKNMGKGYALIYGFRKSSGDIIVFFDSDLDIDPRQIILLVNILKRNAVDIVITSKWHPYSKTISSFSRKFLSRAFYILTRILLGIKLNDTQTGAKAFRRRVLEHIIDVITVKRYAFDIELLTVATSGGYKIVEVPALWHIKLTSKFKIKEIVKMFIDLLAVTYRHRIKRQYINHLNGK